MYRVRCWARSSAVSWSRYGCIALGCRPESGPLKIASCQLRSALQGAKRFLRQLHSTLNAAPTARESVVAVDFAAQSRLA